MGRVIELIGFKLSGPIRNHFALLHEDGSQSSSRGITIDVKTLGVIRENQNWGCGQPSFQLVETGFAFIGPIVLAVFLQQFGHRLGYLGEILDEPVVVSRQSQETVDLSCWEYALEAIMYDVIPNVFIKLLSCPCMNI